MNIDNHQVKRNVLFSPRRSPLAYSPINQQSLQQKCPLASSLIEKKKPHQPRKCCGNLKGCLKMFLTSQAYQQTTSTVNQADNVDKEIARHRDERVISRLKLQRVQDYLSPRTSSAHPSLAGIIEQAKINRWYTEPHEVELCEQIGEGSTANVYRGSWKGHNVAVKCIYPDFFRSNEGGVSFFAQEIETLSRQHHPFVLKLVGACLDPPEHGWVITEFMSTTLKEWLHGKGNRQKDRSVRLPPFEDRLVKAIEVAQAMQYLHEQNPKLVHRDLKPSNVFMDADMHVRVADFGHARFLKEKEQALTGETGTYVYMAPEVIRCEPYNEKCDVYSYAVILNELITGEYPYVETDYGPTEIALQVGGDKLRPKLPEDEDGQLEELIDLIKRSWDEDMSIRPSFATITCTLAEIQKKVITPV